MASVRSFRDLLAYQSARTLARIVRDHTRAFPQDERYGLTNQVRRAAYSVVLNIAEGYGIGTTQATLRHLRIARGSLCEVEAGLDLADDMEFPPASDELKNAISQTGRLLQGLIRSLERRIQ